MIFTCRLGGKAMALFPPELQFFANIGGNMLKNTLAAAIALTLLAIAHVAPATRAAPAPSTWTPDNGNGTYTTPIFYDEFSDPDLIRVGDWFYLTGTTMHSIPGLPVLRSMDDSDDSVKKNEKPLKSSIDPGFPREFSQCS
jgi:hypothetical protein